MSKTEMTVRMKIEVTAEDIKAGMIQSPYDCALALAFERKGIRALVYPTCFKVTPRGAHSLTDMTREQPLPEEAVDFVRKFDDGDFVEPFSFHVDIPVTSLVTA